ncbi:hypothetical protein [Butyricicoccus faecihominis]|uniref:hypothetical protein n=1 Tax=Butyricicoccus faecihominis TaxID=1712515 RepID=UPI0016685F97|nr:hypothetical protein [Butyricicoccus faecihominis]
MRDGIIWSRKTAWTPRPANCRRICWLTEPHLREFQPDEELLQQLYELVSRDGFLSISREMTAQELATDGTAAGVSPNTCYEITVTMNGKQTVVRGDQTAAAYTDTDADAACFVAVTDELQQIVRELPEWKAMPESDGAYQ